jgi:ribonuclease Z
MIDVVLLGTGGMMPLPGRWLSSLAVRSEGELTLLDCGEGTQIAWREAGLSFRRLGAICLSHTHADHVAGLPGMLHAIANSGRVEPVEIYGPVGTARVVGGLRTIAPVLPYPVQVTELTAMAEFTLPGGLLGRCASGEHALPVLAYRLDRRRQRAFLPEQAKALDIPVKLWTRLQAGEPVTWRGGAADPEAVLGPPRPGLAIGFVTDTRPLEGIAELVAGVDLLVCEGTYGDDADAPKAIRNTHMTFREAAALARDAGVGALWLTHFSPAMEDPGRYLANARSIFAETRIGTDGMRTTLSFSE